MASGSSAPITGFNRKDVDCTLDIDLDSKLAERLAMRGDGVSAPVNCNCEVTTPAVICTEWSGADKGRRFLKCPNDSGTSCNFRKWLDGQFSVRARYVIDHMYHIIKQLEFENAVGLGMKHLSWVDYEVEGGEDLSDIGPVTTSSR